MSYYKSFFYYLFFHSKLKCVLCVNYLGMTTPDLWISSRRRDAYILAITKPIMARIYVSMDTRTTLPHRYHVKEFSPKQELAELSTVETIYIIS